MSKQLGDQCTGEFNGRRERRLVTTGIPQAERRADERIGCWNHNSRRRGSVYKFRDKSKVEYDSPTSPISSEAHSRIPRSPRNAATSKFALCQELARLVGTISEGVEWPGRSRYVHDLRWNELSTSGLRDTVEIDGRTRALARNRSDPISVVSRSLAARD